MKNVVTTGLFRGVVGLGMLLAAGTTAYAADNITLSHPHRMNPVTSSNFYFGANLGHSKYKVVDDTSTGYGLFGGYHINKVLAIDVSWTDLGEASDSNARADTSLLQLGMLGKLPVRNDLTLFGKVGLSMWDYDFSNPIDSYNDSNTDAFIGFGADYNIGAQSSVRFGVDFYSLKPDFLNDKENISEFSIGIMFKP